MFIFQSCLLPNHSFPNNIPIENQNSNPTAVTKCRDTLGWGWRARPQQKGKQQNVNQNLTLEDLLGWSTFINCHLRGYVIFPECLCFLKRSAQLSGKTRMNPGLMSSCLFEISLCLVEGWPIRVQQMWHVTWEVTLTLINQWRLTWFTLINQLNMEPVFTLNQS